MTERPSLPDRLAKAASWVREKRVAASERADGVDELVGTVPVHARPADLDRLAELLTEAADAVRAGAA
jgi:hypothetical protein